jgi:hypothetical protein
MSKFSINISLDEEIIEKLSIIKTNFKHKNYTQTITIILNKYFRDIENKQKLTLEQEKHIIK